MARALQEITPHRAASVVSAAVGWSIGWQWVQGGFSTEGLLWAGIAVLGLIQLKLLLPRKT